MLEGIFDSGPPSRITSRLWQGGLPLDVNAIAPAGFDVLVLCAQELQPNSALVPDLPGDIEIICAPLDDDGESGPTPEETMMAAEAANEIIYALRSGKRVLTTCAKGRNRSGLVNALTLVGLYDITGKAAATRVKARRARALTNTGFVAFLNKVPTGGRLRAA